MSGQRTTEKRMPARETLQQTCLQAAGTALLWTGLKATPDPTGQTLFFWRLRLATLILDIGLKAHAAARRRGNRKDRT